MAISEKTLWSHVIFEIYANLNMMSYAASLGKEKCDVLCYSIRAKAFKAYKEGRWQIHSLYENNNWKIDWGKSLCWYCGVTSNKCGKLTAEHIFPRALGGGDNFDNIAYACGSCNSSKGKKDLIHWFVNDSGCYPPYNLVCIYMKLVYSYSMEFNLMDKTFEDISKMNLPFEAGSLLLIKQMIKSLKPTDLNKNASKELGKSTKI